MYNFAQNMLNNTYVNMLVMFIISVLLPSAVYYSTTSPALKKRESRPYPKFFVMLILSAAMAVASFFNMKMLYLHNATVLDDAADTSFRAVGTWNFFDIFIDSVSSQILQIDPLHGNIAMSIQALVTTLFSVFFAFAIIRISDAEKKPLNTFLRFFLMAVFFVCAIFNQSYVQWYAFGGLGMYVITDYINTVTYVCAAGPFVAFPLTMIFSGFFKRRTLDKANALEKLNAPEKTEKKPAAHEEPVKKQVYEIPVEAEIPPSVAETIEGSSRDTLQETLDRVSQVEASVVALSADRAAELSKKLEEEKARKAEEERVAAENEERARAELEAFPEENAVAQAFSAGYGNVGEIMTDIDFESASDEDEEDDTSESGEENSQAVRRPAVNQAAVQHNGATHGTSHGHSSGKRRNKKKKKKK